ARKGQLWLQRNWDRLRIPIRAHLGATLDFQAGTIKRAPSVMCKWGLEWLWRIKEEPRLCWRYLHDGTVLLRLLFTHVLPLAIQPWCLKLNRHRRGQDFSVSQVHDDEDVTVFFSGRATARQVERVIPVLRESVVTGKQLKIDFSTSQEIDARFLGLLLMLRKTLKARGAGFTLTGLSPGLERGFRLNGLDYLLSECRQPSGSLPFGWLSLRIVVLSAFGAGSPLKGGQSTQKPIRPDPVLPWSANSLANVGAAERGGRDRRDKSMTGSVVKRQLQC